jgi:hypothetical protein
MLRCTLRIGSRYVLWRLRQFGRAHLTQKTPIPNAPETIDLSSVGVDAHYLISRYLAFEFDLGCRLRRTELQPHLGAYG